MAAHNAPFSLASGNGACSRSAKFHQRRVSVQPSHLPNSSIKGDGVCVFLSGRDSPYRLDFHAPTKLLPQTIQSPGRARMLATQRDRLQRCHQLWLQRQHHSQVATDLPRLATSGIAGVRSIEAYV
jgi:hypothetical protein